MKIVRSIFLIYLICFQASALTILIDPGHGGEDKGAIGHYSNGVIQEKDIALSISKKVYKILRNKHKVFLTRSFDRTVSLAQRSELAEKVKADLFVSIHVNSSNSSTGNGFETFYLDNHDDVAVKKVENTENKNLEGDDLVINQILTDLVIQNTVVSSKKLANYIHNNVRNYVSKRFRVKDRGIKPGLFYVLALSKRPSVLLEVGFMSNKKELGKIRTRKFQDRYAKAVAEGIDQYIKAQESGSISFL